MNTFDGSDVWLCYIGKEASPPTWNYPVAVLS